MRYVLTLSFIILSLTFMGIGSSTWACPDGFVERILQVDNCLAPGPNEKYLPDIPNFQMACMEATKLAGHAQPILGDKGRCGQAGERYWECCDRVLEAQ